MPGHHIELRGVAVHNLKHVDLDIPHHQLVALCGVSGSGKTSLALDALYAEGQRRYIESFSIHARQFLERLDKPEADRIEGIPAAMAVTRGNVSQSSRSTIGTATETLNYLRLLYSKIARLFCPGCGQPVERTSPEAAAAQLSKIPEGAKLMVAFPTEPTAGETREQLFTRLKEDGFIRIIADGRTQTLEDAATSILSQAAPILVVVDRITLGQQSSQRLRDSLETAFTAGSGRVVSFASAPVGNALRGVPSDAIADSSDAAQAATTVSIDNQPWRRLDVSNRLECLRCNRPFADLEPRRLSFNNPLGACTTCEGLGEAPTADRQSSTKNPTPCPACRGTRLNAEALAWRLDGQNIAELTQHTIDEIQSFLRNLQLSSHHQEIGHQLLKQIHSRLAFLEQVGLGYLALDRTLRTLSSGEAQRVALTSALGSSLVNMLYVLDEPSVGLHPRDTEQLIAAIQRLKDRGNSVVVIEHEEALLRAADQLIEIGPAAGDSGGEVVFQGTLAQMLEPNASLTGEYLAGRRGISIPERRRSTTHGWLKLFGARGNNLKNLTVEFPLGVLCLITGVSGSGKSTLVEGTLYGALCRRKNKPAGEPLPHDDVVGCGQIDDVILVDQEPIGRSARSNPVTYIKAFDQIRAVFAETIEARTHNYTAGHFSFNVEGGRCTACEGTGYIQVDMQFMSDIFMKCAQCDGTRYRKEILAVKYRGQSIAEVLAMTVREAFGFFRGQPKVQARLKQLIDVGLDYLELGQPANTLSSGEAQRLKLAAHLSEASRNRTLFILDEPTTGLHFADIVTLLDCFEALLSVGHSIIAIEHNLQLMRAADYLLDLGPGAGDAGGQIVARGTPEEVAQCPNSHTGRFLAASLAAAR